MRNLATAIITLSAITAHPFSNAYANTEKSDLVTQTICVFDPVGSSGDVFNIMKDFQAKALSWGGAIKLKAFTDESVVVDEFKAGQCDGAVLTGLKARSFNLFSASIEAVGAIDNYKVLRTALTTLMTLPTNQAEKLLRQGPYEVAGIMPAGAIYAFVRDRKWNSLDQIQGKKISVLEGDNVSQSMVREAGGTPVVATTTSFAGKFNNGSVDITFAPAAAYAPLELYQGLGDEGGVVDLIFAQLTFQLLIRWEHFPKDFATQARKTALESFDTAFNFIEKSTAVIDKKYWVKPDEKEIPGYMAMLRQSRISLRDQGIYDAKMLKLLRKIRCKNNPSNAECTEKLE